MACFVREARSGDLGDILAVELVSKGEIGQEYIAGELCNPICRFYVAEEVPERKVWAYLIAWQLDETDFEIHHLATHPKRQRLGLAKMLFHHLLKAHRGAIKRVFLEVRFGNYPAIAFYESQGFFRTGMRKDYYRKPVEDALIYQYNISDER